MKLIPLSKGSPRKNSKLNLCVMVDDEDYEWLVKYHWHVAKSSIKSISYAKSARIGEPDIRMHRLIMGLGDGNTDKRFVDHIDGNGLNNQKSNLRLCNHSQNGANSKMPKKNNIYRGVHSKQSYHKKYHVAQIKVKGKIVYLGCFPGTLEGAIDAAKAYDEAAKKYQGEFATLNFP